MKQLWLYAAFRYPVSKYNELHVANIPHGHRFRSVWNAKKENCKILQPVAAAAVVGRIDNSQKVQLFVVAPFVNVVFVVANYAQQQQKKSPIRTEGGRACAARPTLGRRAVCAAYATTTFVPYFCTWSKGEGSGTWLIAVAQFTTATHCDCCRLGHDSWHCCKLRTWTAEVDVGTQERGHARPLPPVLWPQLRLLHSDFQPYSHFSFYVLTLQMAA